MRNKYDKYDKSRYISNVFDSKMPHMMIYDSSKLYSVTHFIYQIR